jgi:hypothetical protein
MNLKKILVILVVVYLVLSAWRIGTPYIKDAVFQNDLDTIARSLSIDGTVPQARNKVLEAIRINEIPAGEKDITVIRDMETRQVIVGVKYSVSVSTPFGLYTHMWHFNPSAHYGIQKLPRPGG